MIRTLLLTSGTANLGENLIQATQKSKKYLEDAQRTFLGYQDVLWMFILWISISGFIYNHIYYSCMYVYTPYGPSFLMNGMSISCSKQNSMIGKTNTKVLPLPVEAMPIISRPDNLQSPSVFSFNILFN